MAFEEFKDYLTELKFKQLNDISTCRNKLAAAKLSGEEFSFTPDEKVAIELLKHNWTYSHSGKDSAVIIGANNEKRLLDLIDRTTSLDSDTRGFFLALFDAPADVALVELEDRYGYLRGSDFVSTDPAGLVGAILKGLTVQEFKAFNNLRDRLYEIHDDLDSRNLFGRILTTSDVPNYRAVRELAEKRMAETKSRYYFGITLPDSVQQKVDALLQYYKEDLIKLGNGMGEYLLPEFSLNVWESDPTFVEVRICLTADLDKQFGLFLNTDPKAPVKKPRPVRAVVTPPAPAQPAKKKLPAASSKPLVVSSEPKVKKPVQKVAPQKRKGRVAVGGLEGLAAALSK